MLGLIYNLAAGSCIILLVSNLLCLGEGGFKVTLDLCIVLSSHFAHTFQVRVDLATLVDLLHVTLPLLLDLVDVAFEACYHLSHLLLVVLFLAELVFKDSFALD